MTDDAPVLANGSHFEVVRLLYLAPQVQVYKVRNLHLDRYECLKLFVDPKATANHKTLAEARRASATKHPGVVSIYSYGQSQVAALGRKCPWFSMELGEYGDLLEFWHFLSECGWTIDERCKAMLHLLRQVGQTLDDLHRAEVPIIHGDIKPANIIVRGNQFGQFHALISDFGISTHWVESAPGSSSVRGTPQYMSPESFRGDGSSPARDRYAFAATAYEVLHGTRAFSLSEKGASISKSTELLRQYQQLHEEVHLASFVRKQTMPVRQAKALDRVFAQALSADPAVRYRSNLEFIDAVEAVMQGKNRRRGRKYLIAGAMILSVGLIGMWVADMLQPSAVESRQACSSGQVVQGISQLAPAAEVAREDAEIQVAPGCSYSYEPTLNNLFDEDGKSADTSDSMVYLYNLADGLEQRQAEQNAYDYFLLNGEQTNYSFYLPQGQRLNAWVTSSHAEEDDEYSSVCRIQDLNQHYAVYVVTRNAAEIREAGGGDSRAQSACGVGYDLLTAWEGE